MGLGTDLRATETWAQGCWTRGVKERQWAPERAEAAGTPGSCHTGCSQCPGLPSPGRPELAVRAMAWDSSEGSGVSRRSLDACPRAHMAGRCSGRAQWGPWEPHPPAGTDQLLGQKEGQAEAGTVSGSGRAASSSHPGRS